MAGDSQAGDETTAVSPEIAGISPEFCGPRQAVEWISRTSCSTYTRSLKQVGQFRMRIVLRGSAAHRHQAGVLRLLPGLIMDAALPFRPRHDATAIRGDDRQTWRLGILRFESLLGMRGGLLFQMLAQLPPNHAAEIQDLRNADRQLGKLLQHLLRFVGGLVLRVGRDDLVHDRSAIGSLIESQGGTLREKNLGDKPSNGRPVREVQAARQWFPKAGPDAPSGQCRPQVGQGCGPVRRSARANASRSVVA